MRVLALAFAMSLLSPSQAQASRTPEQAKVAAASALAARGQTRWNCSEPSEEALVAFRIEREAAGYPAQSMVLLIRDEKICESLDVVCPFVGKMTEGTFGLTPDAKQAYWATQGRSEDTVMFFSDGPGMKLVSVHNGSRPKPRWERNRYFQPSKCLNP